MTDGIVSKEECHMLQKYRRLLRRRVRLSLMDWLLIVLFLIVWMGVSKPVPKERAIPYIKTSGQVLVQLAKLPKHSETVTYAEPKWTLYRDGTLIFQTDPDDNSRRAQLSPGEIQHILDVIINQDKFFNNTERSFASNTSEGNDDELLLTVDANDQRKEIVLVNEPMKRMAIDSQTTHVFAIEQFLLDYHPSHSILYAPNSGADRHSDDGSNSLVCLLMCCVVRRLAAVNDVAVGARR